MVKFGAQFRQPVGILRLAGHVVDLVWIVKQVVKLFRRAFREAKFEQLCHRRLGAASEDQILGW